MVSTLRTSGSWIEARDGASRRHPRHPDRRIRRKLLAVGGALSGGLLMSAPSAMADVLSPDAAWGSLSAVAVAVAAAPSLAPTGPAVRLELETVAPGLESPRSPTPRPYTSDDADRFLMAPELRTRVWWGTPMVGVGTGADLVSATAAQGLRPMRAVMGVRASMSERTRLVYEVRGPAASSSSSVLLPGGSASEARLALEFRSAKSAAQNLRNGLFRVQLSNSSSLFLKPRSRGLVVSYRSQF